MNCLYIVETADTLWNKASSHQCSNPCPAQYPAMRHFLTFLPLSLSCSSCCSLQAFSSSPCSSGSSSAMLKWENLLQGLHIGLRGQQECLLTLLLQTHCPQLPPPISSAARTGFFQPCSPFSDVPGLWEANFWWEEGRAEEEAPFLPHGDFSLAQRTHRRPQPQGEGQRPPQESCHPSTDTVLKSTWMGPDKDSLLDQTIVRLLYLFLGSSVHFLVKSSFNKSPAELVEPESPFSISDHPWYLIRFLTP